jgi:hypothetical protein
MNWDSLLFFETRKRIPVFVLAVATATLLSFQTSGFSNGPTMCLFRISTGLFCPFCGTTRSVGEILQGNLIAAANLNMYGFVLVAIAVSWAISPASGSSLYRKALNFKIKSATLSQILIISVFGIYSIFKFVESNGLLGI